MSCHHSRVARRFTAPGALWVGASLLLGLPAWSADPPSGKAVQPRVVNTPGLYLSSQLAEAAAPRTITTDALYLSSSASADAGTSGAGAVITTDALYLSSSAAANSDSPARPTTITTDALYLNAKPSSGKR